MAAKLGSYRIACIGLSDADRMSLTSAVNTAQGVLGVTFVWSEPADAAIHIVDVSQVDPLPLTPVILRYASRRNGKEVDIHRPIHVRMLLDALRRAMAAADTQPAPRRYRGAVVSAPANSPSPETNTPKRGVIYRGHRID